jgi:glyoxylase-like metal-dependent hydrolase (beta-lactamase superfamily II)
MNASSIELAPGLCVHSLVGEATSHLIVRKGRSVLIDCHSSHMGRWLELRGLPLPELILHTQVQPEHCREGDTLPEVGVLVHESLTELATDRAAYELATRTVWDNPAEWGETMGREKYGVAGSITVFPPATPLKVAGTFREGERLTWQDLAFEVISLPGHGRHQVGFVLEVAGQPVGVFTGDLLCDRASLVNMYDLEIGYGRTALEALPAVLRSLARRPVQRYFPATGPAIADGPEQAGALANAIDEYQQALGWESGEFQPAPPPDYPQVGRYRQLHRGIYQIDNFGNCILLIDEQGRGLLLDPGPCDFESPARIADFHRDLDLFEREHGLKTIDTTLITHMHGDHYDMAPELRKRYPQCRVGAWDLVARVMEAPWDYPYAALLPWYNLGFDHVAVDDVLSEDRPFYWHDIPISSRHLPGHCNCHAAYLLTFNGLRLAVTGDTIQSRGGAGGMDFIIANHSVPDARSGILKTYRQMITEHVDLNLGGHGSHFRNCAAHYRESLRRIEHALPYLRHLVPGGDLQAAFVRPSWPTFPVSSVNNTLGCAGARCATPVRET